MTTSLSRFFPTRPKLFFRFRWHCLCAVLFLNINFTSASFAQNKIWDKTIGGDSYDDLQIIRQTSGGGYILGGSSNSDKSGDKSQNSKGGTDYWVVKLKPDGTKAWDKTFGGNDNDNLTALQQTSDGGYILGGTSESSKSGNKSAGNKGGSDFWIVKLDKDGNKTWDKTIGGNADDQLTSLQQTKDGGYILGGTSGSDKSGDKSGANKGAYDYWVVKLKADGTKAWDKTIEGNLRDGLNALQQTSDGGYILGGFSNSGKSGDKSEANDDGWEEDDYSTIDYWVVKLNASGTKVWDKTIGGRDDDNLIALQQTSDGGYILGGLSGSDSSSDKSEDRKGDFDAEGEATLDYWVVKINATGKKQWDKTIGGSYNDILTSLQQTKDGGFILGGNSDSGKSGDKTEASKVICEREDGVPVYCTSDYWIVKLKADGSIVWDKTIGGDNEDFLKYVLQASDGSYVLGGSSSSGKSNDKSQASKGREDYWIIKLADKKSQKITFNAIADKTFGDAPFSISAKANSGLPVTFNIVSGPAIIKGNTLTLTGIGQVTVKASQAGNSTYLPADTTQTFAVVVPTTIPWNKTFGGNKPDDLAALVATPDGGYLLGGSSLSGINGDKSENNKGKEDYWLVKTNKTGQKIWDKTFGGSNEDMLTVILPTPDNGYLLGGYSTSPVSDDKTQGNKGLADYWVIKIDNNGNKLWDKTFGGNNADKLTALVTTPDGGYLLGGSSSSNIGGDKVGANKGQWDYWLVKIDASGKKLWDKTYGGAYTDNLAAIVPAANGGYLLGGSSASYASGDKSQGKRTLEDYWVVRISENGNKEWDKTYGGALGTYVDFSDTFISYGESTLSALVATPDGGFLLGGSSNADKGAEKSERSVSHDVFGEDAAYYRDYWVLKIDSKGNKIWDNTYGGIATYYFDEASDFYFGSSELKSIVATPEGNFLLAGTSDSDKGRDKSENNQQDADSFYLDDYWVVQIDGKGNKLWDKTIGGFGGDYLSVALVGVEGNYILGGSSGSSIGADKTEANKQISEDRYHLSNDYWLVNLKVDESPALTTWNMRYGGSSTDGFTTVIKTSDGGFLSGGYSTSGNNGDKSQISQGKNDYWIVKSDKNGKKLWDKRFGGSQDDYLYSVVQTPDGGYLLGGSSLSELGGDKTQAGRGNRDYWIVKVSSTGVKQWDKRFGGSGSDDFRRIVLLANGGFVLAGNSNSPVSGDKTQGSQGGNDYWLIKISSTGTKIWDKRYGGSLNENLEGLATTTDGGFLMGGTSLSGQNGDKTQFSQGGNDFWLVRVDKNGNKVWDKRFGGSGEDYLTALGSTGTATGNFFIAGYSTSGKSGDKSQTSQGDQDFWMLKINGSGGKLWDKRFGGSSNDVLRSIILTQDGGYLLGGTSASGSNGDKTQDSQGGSDYWIVKTNSSGTKLWDKRLGGSGTDELRTVMQTTDGGYLLGGRSASGASGDRTQPSQGGYDYWLVKVAPAAASIVAARETVEAEESIVNAKEVNLQAYPNPFQGKLTIRFTLPETQPTTVKVFDMQGREITTLFQDDALANQMYELEWQAGNKATGLYLLQLQTPTKRHHKKLLLAK